MGLQLCRRGRQGGTEGAAPCCSLLPLSFLVLCLCGGLRHGDQATDAHHLPGMLHVDSVRYVLYFSASPCATPALSGCSRYTVRCFSLLAVLETPLKTSPCKALQPKSWKSILQGRHHPEGLVAGVEPWERWEPSPEACRQLCTPPARSQGKPAGRARPRDAPIPPTSRGRANAGAPFWGPSCTNFPRMGVWGRWCFLLYIEELR